jgi:hypothetical protein
MIWIYSFPQIQVQTIFDIMGKLVFKEQQNSAENFSLAKDLKKGIYFVKAEKEGNLFCKKLIIN